MALRFPRLGIALACVLALEQSKVEGQIGSAGGLHELGAAVSNVLLPGMDMEEAFRTTELSVPIPAWMSQAVPWWGHSVLLDESSHIRRLTFSRYTLCVISLYLYMPSPIKAAWSGKSLPTCRFCPTIFSMLVCYNDAVLGTLNTLVVFLCSFPELTVWAGFWSWLRGVVLDLGGVYCKWNPAERQDEYYA